MQVLWVSLWVINTLFISNNMTANFWLRLIRITLVQNKLHTSPCEFALWLHTFLCDVFRTELCTPIKFYINTCICFYNLIMNVTIVCHFSTTQDGLVRLSTFSKGITSWLWLQLYSDHQAESCAYQFSEVLLSTDPIDRTI